MFRFNLHFPPDILSRTFYCISPLHLHFEGHHAMVGPEEDIDHLVQVHLFPNEAQRKRDGLVLKLRRNHLEILLKCRSWCRRWRVVLTFCISNRLLGDTDTAVFQPELSEPKVWDTEQRMILAWIPLPPHCLVLFTTGDIIINPFVARTKAIIYIENLCLNPLGEL